MSLYVEGGGGVNAFVFAKYFSFFAQGYLLN